MGDHICCQECPVLRFCDKAEENLPIADREFTTHSQVLEVDFDDSEEKCILKCVLVTVSLRSAT